MDGARLQGLEALAPLSPGPPCQPPQFLGSPGASCPAHSCTALIDLIVLKALSLNEHAYFNLSEGTEAQRGKQPTG